MANLVGLNEGAIQWGRVSKGNLAEKYKSSQ